MKSFQSHSHHSENVKILLTLSILTPQSSGYFEGTPLRHTGSFTLPLDPEGDPKFWDTFPRYFVQFNFLHNMGPGSDRYKWRVIHGGPFFVG